MPVFFFFFFFYFAIRSDVIEKKIFASQFALFFAQLRHKHVWL